MHDFIKFQNEEGQYQGYSKRKKRLIICRGYRPTGYSKFNASHAAWRTALVGYIGAPGDVKLYKQVFNLVLVAILNSNP